ncbi:Lipoate-protein ligase A [Sulfobacillus thermosulfidooxidans DSM 9293]|uniref:Lipoate-protein ligase A n=1 Tax=Sulfobacillus thermosulfidooxidans (strain DSM 9293 / VKM B-1269 / AT-1) TaxID=929705 RepID=A0A1W1WFA1_SULTA|nr:lipoate--protein ligase family protein [Sulfobacillus thermosulfidooxidans]SMC04925.1 Lipoate-protein ligase A [Sulfobacillus thermosulfidooxidans DSM 9293]
MLPLYLAGDVNWLMSQALYHGLPVLHEEGIILCWPKEPYVSLGCHQDWDDFDENAPVPVVRRRVGGSLVYLDNQQVFFQIILDPSKHPRLKTPDQWYQFALTPVIACLSHLGFSAQFKPPADILVQNRKISGNAGGQIEDSVVIVGNVLLSFSLEMMARVRKGSVQFKQAFAEAMSRHLVTLEELTRGRTWTPDEVMPLLAQFFVAQMDAHIMDIPWERWQPMLEEVGAQLIKPQWLHAPGYRPPYHQVKVREGVYLRQPRDGSLPDVIAEVDTEKKLLTALWNSPFDIPLPLTQESLVTEVPQGPFRDVLFELMDVKVKDSLLS